MLNLNPKQREISEKALLNVMTVSLATLVGGNILNPKGLVLPLFVVGCMIALGAYVLAILINR